MAAFAPAPPLRLLRPGVAETYKVTPDVGIPVRLRRENTEIPPVTPALLRLSMPTPHAAGTEPAVARADGARGAAPAMASDAAREAEQKYVDVQADAVAAAAAHAVSITASGGPAGPVRPLMHISSLPPNSPWQSAPVAAGSVVAAPYAQFEVPGMLGSGSTRQYIQVVDLRPEHMPPVDVESWAAQERARAEAEAEGAGTGQEVDSRAEAAVRPSHPLGAWSGRSPDEAVRNVYEEEAGRSLSALQEMMARLERQTDALEIELTGVSTAAEAIEHGQVARELGARAGLLTHLERHVEAAIGEGRRDLHAVERMQTASAAIATTAAAPLSPRAAPASQSSVRSPQRMVASPRMPPATAAQGGGRGTGGRGTGGRGTGGRGTVGRGTAARGTGGRSTGSTPRPSEAAATAPPSATASSTLRSVVAPAPPAPASAAGVPVVPRGRGVGSRGSSARGSSVRGGGGRAASSAVRPPPQRALPPRLAPSDSAAPRRVPAVSASQQLLRASAERQKQKHLNTRLARAEATLQKLLSPRKEQGELAEDQGRVTTPARPAAASAAATLASPCPALPAPSAPPAATTSAEPCLVASAAGAPPSATPTSESACGSVHDAKPPSAGEAPTTRRQEIAAIESAEAQLLDAMLG